MFLRWILCFCLILDFFETHAATEVPLASRRRIPPIAASARPVPPDEMFWDNLTRIKIPGDLRFPVDWDNAAPYQRLPWRDDTAGIALGYLKGYYLVRMARDIPAEDRLVFYHDVMTLFNLVHDELKGSNAHFLFSWTMPARSTFARLLSVPPHVRTGIISVITVYFADPFQGERRSDDAIAAHVRGLSDAWHNGDWQPPHRL